MKISKFLVVLIVSLYSIFLYAQEEELCGVENLTAAERQALWEAQSNWLAAGNRGLTESITIPIAFHIVHNNGIGNVSDQDIYNQLDVLNATYSNTNFSFSIEGIYRINNSYWSAHENGSSPGSLEMRMNLAIDPEVVLNFYICDLINDVYGYGTYPWMYLNEPWKNSVVVKYNTLPGLGHYKYNEGKTGTHEVGHFFGLFHVFEDGCDPNSLDDHVTDTPKQFGDTKGCPDPIPDSCPNDPGLDNIHNYMDYSDDDCRSEFTPGQNDRMHQQMLMYRPMMLGIENGVYVSQLRESGSLMIGSKIYHYNSSGLVFDEYLIPAPYFELEPEAIETFRGSQDLIYNPSEKFYIWKENESDVDIINHSQFFIYEGDNLFTSQFKKTYSGITIKNNIEGFDGGTIWFKDPWLIDYPDPECPKPEPEEYYNRNRGMKTYGPDALLFKDKPSPFTPDYTTNYDGDVHQGVFLNQGEDWIPPYYSVKAPDTFYNPQTGKTHQLYFLGWDFNPNKIGLRYPQSSETAVVFKDDNAELTVKLKGTQISSNTNAYTNNSQRKFVRTNNGILFNLYESINRVWLEKSTDGGSTWVIANQGKPLANHNSKNPSMCLTDADLIYIVFEDDNGYIRLYRYDCEYDVSAEKCSIYSSTYLTNTNPVVTYCFNDYEFPEGPVVIWKSAANDGWGGDPGLYYAAIDVTNWNNYSEGMIPNTNINSYNPSIAGNDPIHQPTIWKSSPMIFNLVWEQRNGGNSSILFNQVQRKNNRVIEFSQYQNISDGFGYSKNYNPSIVTIKDGTDNFTARVCWIAHRTIAADSPEGGEPVGEDGPGDPASLGDTKVFYRRSNNQIWSPPSTYGNNINTVNINKNSNNSTFAFAWSEGTSNINKFVKSNDITTVYNTNTTGGYVQVGNYTHLDAMRLNSFTTSTQPNYFTLSNTFNTMPEAEEIEREGLIVQDTTAFYYSIGGITVDGQTIGFIEIPDTVTLNSQEELNSYLISESFNLSESSNFIYGVKLGVTDSLSAASALSNGRFVQFKVELIEDQSGDVLSTFDDVTFNSENIIRYESNAYQVNLQVIGNIICRLKLKTNSNLNFGHSLIKSYNNEVMLAKRKPQTKSLDESSAVTTYALEQNFPNPYNPVTTIRYQIPQDGAVTLKVYDILGGEVATLVNEQKTTGRYEVTFNALSLASGVYLYKIQSGNFVQTKKMIILK